jgi:hypothetical protein
MTIKNEKKWEKMQTPGPQVQLSCAKYKAKPGEHESSGEYLKVWAEFLTLS